MKILMVNKFLYPNGGSETYIFKLGEQLQKKGHEVQYFGMEHAGRIVGNRLECYTSDMDFHAGGVGKLLYPFRIIYSGEAKRKMRRVLEDFRPDVVHLNNINFQLTPSIIYAVRAFEKKRGKRIKIVYTAHDYQWVCPNHMMRIPATGQICFACRGGDFKQCSKNRCIHDSRVKSLIGTIEAGFYAMRKTYGMVDVIICPSEFMKKQLDTDPLLAEKTVMMHNFIDKDTAVAGKTHGKKKKRREKAEVFGAATDGDRPAGDYVLYFGRYAEEKGTLTLLEACRALPEIPFVFAGTGPLEGRVNQAPNVENRGFVAGEELRRLIAGARFSVYPSEWYENCPFSVMESQMYGTPVLASDLGGAPELVQPGRTGDLFRGGDAQELTEHIKELWEDPELCRTYSENCRSINFDTAEEYCAKIVRNIYR
ncbi:MAG: glycosyltransferase family 4 protein [Lachnospiraceae bacterium]|nr:glycosyltransferase family 4 protein [Lachnospiraceae bacterium]